VPHKGVGIHDPRIVADEDVRLREIPETAEALLGNVRDEQSLLHDGQKQITLGMIVYEYDLGAFDVHKELPDAHTMSVDGATVPLFQGVEHQVAYLGIQRERGYSTKKIKCQILTSVAKISSSWLRAKHVITASLGMLGNAVGKTVCNLSLQLGLSVAMAWRIN